MPDPPPEPISPEKEYWVAQNLAARLLARPWTLSSVANAIREILPKMPSKQRAALAVRVFELGEDTYPPTPPRIVAFLLDSQFFTPKPDQAIITVLDAPDFAPLLPFAGLKIPALETPAELADWFGLSVEELEWFSDARRGQARASTEKLLHYRYILVRKPNGTPRLLEAPKARLKGIQRRILRKILAPIPVQDRAHGFVTGRSCLTGAQIHANEAVVASFDLSAFFPSISAPRIHGIFRSLGYPWAVARYLTGLCTTSTPPGVINHLSGAAVLNATYGIPHLPQGAPTSPALANLLAWRLDRRLDGLARAAGANYSRYADDLAFSGGNDFARSIGRFSKAVAIIATEEGFYLNQSKTHIMHRHQRQQVTGLVVNDHININRTDFDTLKATLHNCVRQGPGSQNRTGAPDFRRHLDGRINWVEQANPRRGAKLRQMFNRIDWEPGK
jgi:retron-type reverse transcriptase